MGNSHKHHRCPCDGGVGKCRLSLPQSVAHGDRDRKFMSSRLGPKLAARADSESSSRFLVTHRPGILYDPRGNAMGIEPDG